MEELFKLLGSILTNQPLLQVFVGGGTLMVIARMVMRARSDKETLPAPASHTIADVPQPFLQGPREVIDIMRENRDFLRRMTEDSGQIRECVRITREETKKQTEILERMSEDQRVEHRARDIERRKD